jgi:hypothetical protein
VTRLLRARGATLLTVLAVVAVTGCGSSDLSDGSDSDPTPTLTETAASDVSVDEPPAEETPAEETVSVSTCGHLALLEDEPMPGREAAGCLVDSMIVGESVLERVNGGEYDGQAELIFLPEARARVTTSDSRLTIIGTDAWHEAGGQVIKADPNGDPSAQLADAIAQGWRAFSDPGVMKTFLAKHGPFDVEYDVTVDGRPATKLTARNRPTVFGVRTDSYVVWVDDQYRPITIEAVGSGMGITATTVQEFSDWGEVEPIEPPA